MRADRIELLRQETADAERRAGQVAEEMKELVTQLSRKQKSMDDKSTELITCGLFLLAAPCMCKTASACGRYTTCHCSRAHATPLKRRCQE